eukprot:8270028-Pyramimonas_sp.AAC.1
MSWHVPPWGTKICSTLLRCSMLCRKTRCLALPWYRLSWSGKVCALTLCYGMMDHVMVDYGVVCSGTALSGML